LVITLLLGRYKVGTTLNLSQFPNTFLEWVWDGQRLWIVQNDKEDNSYRGTIPGSSWDKHLTSLSELPRLSCFKNIEESTFEWKKIECVKTFKTCSLPYGNIYILEDESIIKKIALGQFSETLIKDLKALLQTAIVIRMDINKFVNILLPRTETILDLDKAKDFLKEKSKEFLERYVGCKFCFLIHRFIVSKSCALAYSKPNISKIRLDSTWGIVDGLYYHPHDSYEIDIKKNRIVEGGTKSLLLKIEKKQRCKTEYIDVDESGQWCSRKSGTQWDWEESLNREQIEEIVQYNQIISKFLNKPVVVMYFVGVNPKTGYYSIVPWFYSVGEIPDVSNENFKDNIFSSTNFLIQNEIDFANLKEHVQKEAINNAQNKITVRINFSLDIIRDKYFVEKLGTYAFENNIPIELEGSVLAHPYYILKKLNVAVSCIDNFSPKVKRKFFGKLVRDKVPDNIEANGEVANTQSIPTNSRILFLKLKLIEEAFEFFWENTREKRIEELADLYEVVRAICKELDISIEELVDKANNKNKLKGGFDRGLFLFDTYNASILKSDNNSKSNIDAYSLENNLFKGRKIRKGELIPNGFIVPYIPPFKTGSLKPYRYFIPPNIEILYNQEGIRVKFITTTTDPNQLTLF
jgi:predicted house-cleaning noncanonical NTP pyrophosphatase (MazG superfamily)